MRARHCLLRLFTTISLLATAPQSIAFDRIENNGINAMEFSRGVLYLARFDGSIDVVEASSGRLLWHKDMHRDRIDAICLQHGAPPASMLGASAEEPGDDKGRVVVWDAASGETKYEVSLPFAIDALQFQGDTSELVVVGFAEDYGVLAAIDKDGHARICKAQGPPGFKATSRISALARLGDTQVLLGATETRQLLRWNQSDSALGLKDLNGKRASQIGRMQVVSVVAGKNRAFVGTESGIVAQIDLKSNTVEGTADVGDAFLGVRFLAAYNTRLLASIGSDLLVVDVDESKMTVAKRIATHHGQVFCGQFDPASRFVYLGHVDGKVTCWALAKDNASAAFAEGTGEPLKIKHGSSSSEPAMP